MSSFPISATLTVNLGNSVNSFKALGQAASALDQALMQSGQKLDQFGQNINQLDGPLKSAGQGMGELGDGMEQLEGTVGGAADGMGEMADATGELEDPLSSVADSSGEAAEGIGELGDSAGDGVSSMDELAGSSEEVNSGFGELASGSEEVISGFEGMTTGTEDLNTGFGEMNTVVEETNTGFTDMTTAAEETTTGLEDMATGAEDTTTGIEDLGTGVEDAGTGFEDFGTSLTDATSGLEGFEEGIGDTGAGVSVLSGSFDDATDSSEGFSGALTNMDAPLQGVNGGLTTGNTLTTNLTGSTTKLGGSFSNLGVSMAGISGAAIGLFNAYDNIGDAAVAVNVAQGNVIRTQGRLEGQLLSLSKQTEALNTKYAGQVSGLGAWNAALAEVDRLLRAGVTSGKEWDAALVALGTAHEGLTSSTLDGQQAIDGLGKAYKLFEATSIKMEGVLNAEANSREAYNQTLLESATSIIPSVILGLSGLKGATEAVTGAVGKAPAVFKAFSGALAGLPAVFSAIGSAISGTMIPALAAIAAPAAIAVLAIGAVVTTIMAIRSALPVFDQMGAAIGNAFPQMVGFLNDLRAAFISTSDAVNSSISFMLGGLDQLTGGTLKLKEGFDKWVSTLPGAAAETTKLGNGIKVLDTSATGLNASITMAKDGLKVWNGNLKDSNNEMIATKGNWKDMGDGTVVVTKRFEEASTAIQDTSATQAELNNILKPYVPLAQNAAGATDAQGQSAAGAEQMNVALKAALEGDTSALATFIQGANGGATSAQDLGAGAEVATEGVEGITPAAGDAGQATITFDQALQAAAQSTDPFVAGVAQAAIQLRDQAKEADNTLVKNKTLLSVWGVEIPAAIANDVNAIQALVNIHQDEHSAMDQTLIKANESILKYGDLTKATNMTRDEKIAYAEQLEETAKAEGKASEATEEATSVLEDNAEAIKKSRAELVEYVNALSSGVPQAQAFTQGQIKANQALVDLILKVSEASGELSTYGQQLADGRQQAFLYAEGQQAIYKSILDNIAQISNLQGQIDALNASLQGAALVEFAKGLLEGSLAASKLTTELSNANGEWLGFRNALLMANPELKKFGDLSQFTNEHLADMAASTQGGREAIHKLVEAFMEGAASFNDFVASVDFREIDDKVKEGVDKFREGLGDMVDIAREQGVKISDEFVAALDFDNAIQTAADVMSQFWPTVEAAVATGNPDFIVQGIDLFTANVKHALEDADLPAAAATQIGGIMAEIERLKTIKDPVELLNAMNNIKTRIDALKDGKGNLEGMTTALTGLTNVSPANMTTIAQGISDMALAASALKLSPAQIDAWAQSLSQLTGVPVDQLKAALETKMAETGASATTKLLEAGPGGDAARVAFGAQMVALAQVMSLFQQGVDIVITTVAQDFQALTVVIQTQTRAMGVAVFALAQQLNTFGSTFMAAFARDVGTHFTAAGRHAATFATIINSGLSTAAKQLAAFGDRFMPAFVNSVANGFNAAGRSSATFSSQIQSNMSRASSSMQQAESRAKALASAINALKSKTITITTVYVTIRRTIFAAHGGAFVQSSPGKVGPLHVSEFGQQELVTVTPLQGAGRQPVKGISDLIGKEAEKKGRRAMTEEEEKPTTGKKEVVMMRETPIIIQVDGREIARVVNKRIFEESDALV